MTPPAPDPVRPDGDDGAGAARAALLPAEPVGPVRYPQQGGAAVRFVEQTPPRPAPRRRGGRGVSPWLVFVLLVIIAGLLFRLGLLSGGSVFDPEAAARPVTARGELAPAELTTVEIFERVSPSVVHLTGEVPGPVAADPAGGPGLQTVRQVSGSGFVWSADGHVVTNSHVVEGAENLRVTLADGTTYAARRVGALPARDIAVVKIGAPPGALAPIPVGESGDLRVGQQTFAIGSPFGLDQTLTTGVVSGLDRAIPNGALEPGADVPQGRITGAIQTDAAINVGNSGGPLIDSAGRLIGMNTAIYSETGRGSGIGFAVPVDDINRFVPELIRTGEVRQVGIGIGLEFDPRMRRFLRQGLIPRSGALVAYVLPGSAADRAGLLGRREDGRARPGDLIVAVDGANIESGADLKDALTRRVAGETVELTVLRSGEADPRTLSATLQELPEFDPAAIP